MRLQLKTVAGASATIDVEPDLPLSVARAQAASALALEADPVFVLKGRMLAEAADGSSLADLGLEDGGFVVVVAAKPALPEASPPLASPSAASAAIAGGSAAERDGEVARQLQAEEDQRTAMRVQELQDGDLAREEQARQALGEQRAAELAAVPQLCFVRGDLPACGESQWIPLMVDTGAQMSVITSGLADRLGLSARLDRTAAGVAGGVGQARVLGRLRGVVVRFGELDLEVDFSVLDGSQMPSPNLAILGLDQLAVHHMVVDLDGRVLRVGGIEGYQVRFLERYEIPDEFRLDAGPRQCAVQ